MTTRAELEFSLRYRAAVQAWIRFYWPCEITRLWAEEGYTPGTAMRQALAEKETEAA